MSQECRGRNLHLWTNLGAGPVEAWMVDVLGRAAVPKASVGKEYLITLGPEPTPGPLPNSPTYIERGFVI